MSKKMKGALNSLLNGRDALRKAYQQHLVATANAKKTFQMTFALDGRLVGDIGELIAAEVFQLDLLGTGSKNVDAETTGSTKWRVQVKSTFVKYGLSIKHGGDHFIGLKLDDLAQFRVIYNGPAAPVMRYLKAPASHGKTGRKKAGKHLESISLEAWSVLNLDVADSDRVPRRKQ